MLLGLSKLFCKMEYVESIVSFHVVCGKIIVVYLKDITNLEHSGIDKEFLGALKYACCGI